MKISNEKSCKTKSRAVSAAFRLQAFLVFNKKRIRYFFKAFTRCCVRNHFSKMDDIS